MVKNIVVITLLFTINLTYSYAQDLIDRTRQGGEPSISSARENIDYQYLAKSKLTEISPFTYTAKKKFKSVKGIDAVSLEIAPSAHKALLKEKNWKLNVPVDENSAFSLSLYPIDITTPDYKVYNANDEEVLATRMVTYRGMVSDDPSSTATVVVTPDEIKVVISDDHGNYNLGIVNGSDQYALANDADYGAMPFDCGVVTDDVKIKLPGGAEVKHSYEKMGKCVKVWAELDYNSFKTLGGTAKAEAFIRGAFTVVSTLYAQYNVDVKLSGVKVWTSQDPYGAASNVSSALTYLRNNNPSFTGDLFHLVSAKNTNTFSGIAFLACRSASLCKATTIGTRIPYAVSQSSTSYRNYPNYSWTVAVLAHEMGHNMGAPHTHECAWGPNNNTTIDECIDQPSCDSHNPPIGDNQGTLMSYCHLVGKGINFNTGFGDEVGRHIYNEYVYAQSVLKDCAGSVGSTPTCSDGVQNGNETGVDCGGACPPCGSPDASGCSSPTVLASTWINNFESGLSGFIQSTDDNADWIRKSGRTPSGRTGPSAAAEGSAYLFIESSRPNYPNKTAILKSNCIDISRLSSKVLTFKYHMYGSTMGSLEVQVVNSADGAKNTVWSSSGNKGDKWLTASVDLNPYSGSSISLEIKGTTGTSWRSDMAIDDIRIGEGAPSGNAPSCSDGVQNGNETGVDCGGSCAPCAPTPTCSDGIKNGNETGVDCGGSCAPCAPTSTCSDGIKNGNETGVDCGGSCAPCAPTSTCSDGIKNGNETGVDCGGSCAPCPSGGGGKHNCTNTVRVTRQWSNGFENGLGDFEQVSSDNADWIRGSGSTPSRNTGPSAAYEGTYYMYIESSRPNYPNKTAILQSKCIDLSGINRPTLSLDYHLYGSTVGSLDIVVIETDTDRESKLVSISGNQGNQWRGVSIDLTAFQSKPIIIRIVGTTGRSWRSDIAVDNINLFTASNLTSSTTAYLNDCYKETVVIDEATTYSQNSTEKTNDKISLDSKVGVTAKLKLQAAKGVEVKSEVEVKKGAELIISTENCKEN